MLRIWDEPFLCVMVHVLVEIVCVSVCVSVCYHNLMYTIVFCMRVFFVGWWKRRRRHDDGHGGRQPKVKKLNRQKYNEYKYAAKDILDDDSVAEEHRSNLLGQIWAKGERMGVEETYAFINDKEEELIISKEVAERLTTLVRALTTRRWYHVRSRS